MILYILLAMIVISFLVALAFVLKLKLVRFPEDSFLIIKDKNDKISVHYEEPYFKKEGESFKIVSLRPTTVKANRIKMYDKYRNPLYIDIEFMMKISTDKEELKKYVNKYQYYSDDYIVSEKIKRLLELLQVIFTAYSLEEIQDNCDTISHNVSKGASNELESNGLHLVSFKLKDVRKASQDSYDDIIVKGQDEGRNKNQEFYDDDFDVLYYNVIYNNHFHMNLNDSQSNEENLNIDDFQSSTLNFNLFNLTSMEDNSKENESSLNSSKYETFTITLSDDNNVSDDNSNFKVNSSSSDDIPTRINFNSSNNSYSSDDSYSSEDSYSSGDSYSSYDSYSSGDSYSSSSSDYD